MKETRIVYNSKTDRYRAQYKKWYVWWDIYDEELNVWWCTFWYEHNAKRAIDRFIANNYKQPKSKDTTITKYP